MGGGLAARPGRSGPEQLCPDRPELHEALRLHIGKRKRSIAQVVQRETPSDSVDYHSAATPAALGLDGGSPTERELTAGLSPPQGPGELGRLGPYRILRVLGTGGMGIVFQAEESQPHRLVAVKVFRSDLPRPGKSAAILAGRASRRLGGTRAHRADLPGR